MSVTPIYMHEYTFTPWRKERIGIQSIAIIVVSQSKERENFIDSQIDNFLGKDCNITHRILLEGYKSI